MGKIKKENVIEVLKQCYDPEIPVDLWSLGLIYEIEIQDSYEGDTSDINIVMSLTTPGCGMGQMMADDIRTKLEARDKLGFAPSPSTGQTGDPVTINTEWE